MSLPTLLPGFRLFIVLFLAAGALAATLDQADAQQPPAKQPAHAADPFGSGADPFDTPVVRKKIADTKPDPNAPNKKQPSTDESIRLQLGEAHSVRAIQQPLQEFIQVLSQEAEIPMLIDRRALEEIGLTADEPVTIDLANVSLRSILRLSLRGLDLTYLIKDDVLQITTIQAAEQNLTVIAYALPVELADRSEKIIAALTATVVPDTWQELGGPSSVKAIDNVLVVSAVEPVHDQVVDFIEKVEEAFKSRQKTVPAKQ
ncbi:MAG: hypothetical protein WBD20_21845 [Pirellulaceae bacterium]